MKFSVFIYNSYKNEIVELLSKEMHKLEYILRELYCYEGIIRITDGLVSGTDICIFANRRLENWIRTFKTTKFIKAVSRKLKLSQDELVIINRSGSGPRRGTWLHPLLAVNLLMWISPTYFARVCDIIDKFDNNKDTLINEVIDQHKRPEVAFIKWDRLKLRMKANRNGYSVSDMEMQLRKYYEADKIIHNIVKYLVI